LRKALPAGFLNPESWTTEFTNDFKVTFQKLLSKIAEQAAAVDALHVLREEFRDKQKPKSDGHFQEIDNIESLHLDSRLKKRTGMNCNIQVIGNFCRIIFPGNIVKGPAHITETLQYIANANDAFSLKDLPSISDNNKIQLAARLIRGGLLQFA